MEWRGIPDYPGYEVNRKGVIRKAASGYVYGNNANLRINGRQKWVNGPKLAREVFAEPQADLPPVPSPFVALAPDPDATPVTAEPDQVPASVPDPVTPEPIPATSPVTAPVPEHDPAIDALRDDLAKARRSLELARRVNGHQSALIVNLRARLAEYEGNLKKRGRPKAKSAKAREVPDAEEEAFYEAESGNLECWEE